MAPLKNYLTKTLSHPHCSYGGAFSTPTKQSQTEKKDRLGLVPDLSWNIDDVEISYVDVSPWEGIDKYVKVMSNILTKKECDDLIQLSESRGYEQALVNTGPRQVLMTDVRNNDRCIIDSPVTTEFMWQRVLKVSGDDVCLLHAPFAQYQQKLDAVGLNERMRVLRYDPGTYFSPHYDGCYQRGYEAGERRGEHSCVTFMLYLNEGYVGGSTRLLDCRDESRGFNVVPQTGSVLLFQHDVFHEGSPLIEGRKYALRTDVMYTDKGPGHEYAKDVAI